MSEATFADSEKQDCPPPTSHYGQICCCYRAAQAALPYGHQSNRVTEGVWDLEQCNFCRAEEWLRSLQLHKKAFMCLIKSSNEMRDERLSRFMKPLPFERDFFWI